MARQARLVLPGQPHHVIQRGNNRQAIVAHDGDRRAWCGILAESLEREGIKLHAYVLMDNHFHLLLSPPDAPSLSRMMQSLGRRYVGGFNAVHGRTGTLWEGRFRASPIESERYFLACQRYIELNPVRAGMVERPEDHPWSSARHHLGLQIDRLVSDHSLYWSLGNTPFERQSAYRALLQEGMPEVEVRQITRALLRDQALGSKPFLERWSALTERPLLVRPRGRPRKRDQALLEEPRKEHSEERRAKPREESGED